MTVDVIQMMMFSSNSAAVLWDHFPPMACDIHAAAYSQVMMMMYDDGNDDDDDV
jgi:hypothetical protein